jgi:hypothetical protein
LRPRYFPAKGTITMVSISWSCSKLASHSFCASDSASSSESRMPLEMEGRDSTSSFSEEAAPSDSINDSEPRYCDMTSSIGGDGSSGAEGRC